MRCPTCQAANPDGAAFCGQCYTRFATPSPGAGADDPSRSAAPPPTGPHRGPADPGPPDPTAVTDPDGGGPATATRSARAGRFAAVDGELTWRCAVCDTTNPLGAFTCEVCGNRMDAEAAPGAGVDWPAARRAEALVPGLGHVRAGLTGMGAARMAITGLWLLGALLLALGGSDGIATAVPLLVGVAVVWATGPGDLDAARAGREPRLDPRGFLYVVIGVTLGVIVAGGITIVL